MQKKSIENVTNIRENQWNGKEAVAEMRTFMTFANGTEDEAFELAQAIHK